MNLWKKLLGLAALATAAASCAPTVAEASQVKMKDAPVPTNASSLVVGGGCFWCVEAVLEDLKGVYAVESGYAGGQNANATYDQVLTGQTGHAEVVKVFFDPKAISAADILHIFMVTHDPTTLNRQGPDYGTQYRSVIFYSNPEEKALGEKIKVEMKSVYKDPIVTTIEPLKNYARAEEYHQNYFAKYEKATPTERSRMNAGYCSAIIEPKVRKFREKYINKLKKNS